MMPEEVTEREWFTERAMSPANAAKECEERGGRLCSPSELRLWRWDHGPGGDGEGMVDEKAGVPFAVWTSYRCHSCWMKNPGVGKCQGGGIFEDNYRRRLIGGGNLDSSHGKSFALATVTTATTKARKYHPGRVRKRKYDQRQTYDRGWVSLACFVGRTPPTRRGSISLIIFASWAD